MFVIQPEFEMQHRNLIYIRSQNHQESRVSVAVDPQAASRRAKRTILDEFIGVSGYHPKYAIPRRVSCCRMTGAAVARRASSPPTRVLPAECERNAIAVRPAAQ